MRFKKGHQKVGGKKKGSKNKKTIEWEAIGEYLVGEGAERAKQILMSEPDKEFMNHFNLLLEYFKPKLARSETDLKIEKNEAARLPDIYIGVDQLEFKKQFESNKNV